MSGDDISHSAHSVPSVHSVRSAISDCISVVSSSRIMKIRTLNESLLPQTEQQRDVVRVRRKLRCHGLSRDNEAESTDSESILSVSFDTVEVREYPIILGDNPAVSQGPPLTIDWEHDNEDTFSLDEYETTRPPRRVTVEMSIPPDMRLDCLKRCGFSTKEISVRIKEINLVKRGRLQTTTMLYRSDMNERVEKTKRIFTSIFTKKKRKERALMKSSDMSLEIQRTEANNQATREQEDLAAFMRENKDTDS